LQEVTDHKDKETSGGSEGYSQPHEDDKGDTGGSSVDRKDESNVTTPEPESLPGTATTDDSGTQQGSKTEKPAIKYLIWIDLAGNGGRIHAGTKEQFKSPKKYKNEWLFGMSDEYLEKKQLPYGPFATLEEAKTKACGIISNPRYVRILGWGSVPAGDYGGTRYWIDGLGCEIKK